MPRSSILFLLCRDHHQCHHLLLGRQKKQKTPQNTSTETKARKTEGRGIFYSYLLLHCRSKHMKLPSCKGSMGLHNPESIQTNDQGGHALGRKQTLPFQP